MEKKASFFITDDELHRFFLKHVLSVSEVRFTFAQLECEVNITGRHRAMVHIKTPTDKTFKALLMLTSEDDSKPDRFHSQTHIEGFGYISYIVDYLEQRHPQMYDVLLRLAVHSYYETLKEMQI